MTKWLEQASQWHEMYSHDLEVMSSDPGLVKLGVRSTSLLELTDGQVVRAGISVIWNVLSWSGGHEFEPRLGQTLGA